MLGNKYPEIREAICVSSASRKPRKFLATPIPPKLLWRLQKAMAPLQNRKRKKRAHDIGILGGGQLGYMLALAGYRWGCVSVFSTVAGGTGGEDRAPRDGEYTDEQALEKFAHGLEVATYGI